MHEWARHKWLLHHERTIRHAIPPIIIFKDKKEVKVGANTVKWGGKRLQAPIASTVPWLQNNGVSTMLAKSLNNQSLLHKFSLIGCHQWTSSDFPTKKQIACCLRQGIKETSL